MRSITDRIAMGGALSVDIQGTVVVLGFSHLDFLSPVPPLDWDTC